MAKSNKTGGKPAKSGASNTNLLLLVGAGLAAYVLTQGGSSAASSDDKAANDAAGAGAYDNAPVDTRPTSSVPTSVPSSVPPSVKSSVNSAGQYLDNWGTPHRTAAHAAQRNTLPDYEGQVHKVMFEMFGILSESTETLINRDAHTSPHTGTAQDFVDIYNWLTVDTRANGQLLLNAYGSDISPGR